jgi:hypothetical protein
LRRWIGRRSTVVLHPKQDPAQAGLAEPVLVAALAPDEGPLVLPLLSSGSFFKADGAEGGGGSSSSRDVWGGSSRQVAPARRAVKRGHTRGTTNRTATNQKMTDEAEEEERCVSWPNASLHVFSAPRGRRAGDRSRREGRQRAVGTRALEASIRPRQTGREKDFRLVRDVTYKYRTVGDVESCEMYF